MCKEERQQPRLSSYVRLYPTTPKYYYSCSLLHSYKKNSPRPNDHKPTTQTYRHDRTDARILTGTFLRCMHSLPNFRFWAPCHGGVLGVRPSRHVVHDEDHEHEMRAVPLTMSSWLVEDAVLERGRACWWCSEIDLPHTQANSTTHAHHACAVEHEVRDAMTCGRKHRRHAITCSITARLCTCRAGRCRVATYICADDADHVACTCSCTASPRKGCTGSARRVLRRGACHVRKAIAYEAHAHCVELGVRAA